MSSSSSSSPQETSSVLPSGSDEPEEKPYHGPLYWTGWGHFEGVYSRDLTSEEVAEIRPELVREMIAQKVYVKRKPHEAATPARPHVAHMPAHEKKGEEPATVADEPRPYVGAPQNEE